MKGRISRKFILITVSLILSVLLFGASVKPVVNENKCTGCGDCIEYCPVKAIEKKDMKAVIDAKKCINCKLCVPVCTNDAIE